MADITKFKHKKHICLTYQDECYISGVSPSREIIVGEYYDDSFFAQHSLTFSGEIITTRDEDYGNTAIKLIDIASDWQQPEHPQSHPLNYTGLRYRGMREADKVAEWVKPIPMLEKMPLMKKLDWSISPTMLMGIAESRVLSETRWLASITIVCRRVRLLVALPQPQIDDGGLPYDYETRSMHIIHPYDYQSEDYPPLNDALAIFPQVVNATDCLFVTNHLIVADSGFGERDSSIHLYHLDEQNS